MKPQFLPLLPLFFSIPLLAAPTPEQTVEIKTLTAQMRYDTPEFTVPPGTPVRVVFNNVDDLPHNIVFCQTGTDVLAMSMHQMEHPENAVKNDWVPEDPAIFAHSRLVNPHDQQEVRFTAPEKAGDYPFVCTFPGHALTMKGVMKVLTPGERLRDLKFKLYLGRWKNLPDFNSLTPHREGDIQDGLVQLKLDDYKNEFGLVFTGKLDAPKKGSYQFNLASDDGSRLFVDGKRIVDDDGIHPTSSIKSGKVNLQSGPHEIRVEYFQATGEAELYASWQGPGFDITPLSKWLHPNWKSGAKPKKEESFSGMPLVVKDEALIYRNFIQGAGNRAIGVGYPGGFNIAWSAEHMNVALIWRGAFIDAARHWTGRGGGAQPPMGYDVFSPASGEPLAVLTTPEEAWPEYQAHTVESIEPETGRKDVGKLAFRAPDYQWKGYRLDAKRLPTFYYTWNGLRVEDRFDTQGDGKTKEGRLIRTVKLIGAIPPNTYLRVAIGGNILRRADGVFDVDQKFIVQVDGALQSQKQILVPAKAEMKVIYGWPR